MVSRRILRLALVSIHCVGILATTNADLPPDRSGSLRGSESLLGYGGQPITNAGGSVVANPQYVPGQKDPATDNVYLDFQNVKQPQPVRGDRGGTDPGHRKCVMASARRN